MKTDEYGNKLFENAQERFLSGIQRPYWIPFEGIKFETENMLMITPLDVWIPRIAIVKQEKDKLHLRDCYIVDLLDIFANNRNSVNNARVILENLNKPYEREGNAPLTALP